jgi:hypothetical protein
MSYTLANPSLIGIGRVEAHALRLAEKVLPSGGLEVELWLQRVRRLGHTLSKPYEALSRRLAKQRERSQKQQVLPPPCPNQEMQIGKDERAHLNMERIGVFLTRVLRRYPFIYQIRRVEKDGRLRVTRPTLLGVDNLSQHLPAGTSDPGNIIPLALDGSYTAEDVALRMNIVLSTDITPPMRDAALQLLRRDKELFEFR